MKKNYIKIALLLFSTILAAQKSKLSNDYISYFENTREIPFLHLNKTSFLKGEEIWFKAYIQEQNSRKLHPTTTNLYVSIFEESGKLKDQQLIHIKDAMGSGSIDIDSTYTNGNYYLKASTNWMKNFKEDNSFDQKIKIISSLKNTKKITRNKGSYEFKLFPEGGHIIENTNNNLGILIKDHTGKGIKINKGIIRNKSKETIRFFKTNSFGLGNVNLYFNKNDIYEFEVLLENGISIKANPPIAKEKGLAMRVVNSNPKFLSITLNTNNNSLKSLNKSNFKVLIHNTRKYRNYNFKINNSDTKYSLLINKNELPSGINIITVFDKNNTPILERLIFINNDSLFAKIKIEKKSYGKDSLEIKLSNLTNDEIYLSSSFLPEATKGYKPQNNITTNFIFKPFVKGGIENANYYFKNINLKKLRDLDLLLITQGWSKYNWNNIFNKPPKRNFKFENGIDITLKTNKTLSKKQSILIYSSENKIVDEIKHYENPYILKNYFIKKNSSFEFALKNNNNLIKITPILSYSKHSIKESFNNEHPTENTEIEVSNFPDFSKKFETLNEVIVKASKRKINTNIYGGVTILRNIKMKNIMINSGETVIDFLQIKGYVRNYDDAGNLSFKPKSGTKKYNKKAFSSKEKEEEAMSSFHSPSVKVYLDGQEITLSLWMIEGMYLDTIEEIFYGQTPGRIYEEIHIKSLPFSNKPFKKKQFSTIKMQYGFASQKEFYSPKYPSFINKTYKDYGAIYWEPNITIAPNSSINFKIPKNEQKYIKAYIEGISKQGKLLSKESVLK